MSIPINEPLHFDGQKLVTESLEQCFSKWAESTPWGRFWWARGRKNIKGSKCSITKRPL